LARHIHLQFNLIAAMQQPSLYSEFKKKPRLFGVRRTNDQKDLYASLYRTTTEIKIFIAPASFSEFSLN